MKFKKLLFVVCIILNFQILFSQNTIEIPLQLLEEISNETNDINKETIRLIIKSAVKTNDNLLVKYDANPFFSPILKPSINIATFTKNSIEKFLLNKGFEIQAEANKILVITIQQFEINYLSGNGWTGTVKLNTELIENNQLIYHKPSMGYNKIMASSDNYKEAANVINTTFYNAVSNIEWQKITEIVCANNRNASDISGNENEIHDNLANNQKTNISLEEKESFVSDIDVNIPVTTKKAELTFAVVIGNENYSNEINVKYAKNDAQTFYKYLDKTIGVPTKQMHLVINATYGKMLSEIDWLMNVMKAYDGEANIIFYYAGHGMPDESTKSAYLLPVDGNASQLLSSIKVDDLYANLTKYKSKKVLIFLDACFSGASRDGMLASGRGVKIKPKTNPVAGNIVVFSAVSGEETAHPYDEQKHGLFTYFLLKKIQESKGNITLEELYNSVHKKVNRNSVINGTTQTPVIQTGEGIKNNWKNLILLE
jgi:Caspase domain